MACASIVAPASAVADLGDGNGPDEPLLGVPGLAGLVSERAELTLDPAYWTQFISNAAASKYIAPLPVDAIKVEQALPTSPVEPGSYTYRLRRRPLDLGSLTYEWQGRTKTLAEFMRTSETDATVFVHDGAVVSELYENGWSAGARHQPWSVTKSFISALVGIAIGEGRVDSLRDPIDAYIPRLAGTAWEGTTIRNLLEMESGVHWDEGTPVLVVNTQVQQWIEIILDYYTDGELGQTRNEFLASLPRVAPQGTRFSYNSGNTQVLGWMLERVYRRPLNEVLSEKLWKPAGMADGARMMTDRLGDVIGSQGLYARSLDFARFGELFRNGGRTPSGRRVIPKAWVRASTTMTRHSEGDYAFQWWHGPLAASYEASGLLGNKISVTRRCALTGVRLSHALGMSLEGGFSVVNNGDEWGAVYRAVAEELGGCGPKRRG
jgi:CubicO group peptidase (beta-lactamase class C family)